MKFDVICGHPHYKNTLFLLNLQLFFDFLVIFKLNIFLKETHDHETITRILLLRDRLVLMSLSISEFFLEDFLIEILRAHVGRQFSISLNFP